jgi:hypothetical protein
VQAPGQPGLGLCLHRTLRAHPQHQVWPRPIFSHPDLNDDPLAAAEHWDIVHGRLCVHGHLQEEAQGRCHRGPHGPGRLFFYPRMIFLIL